MNRLAKEKSAYLQHAAKQKIDWYPWGEEAFERARQEDKPLFMSSGAVWCHWCHVMAMESFEDEETAGLVNKEFISVKLDRDERPDIDRIYQQAAAVMGAGGGWPLSIFLTPDKKPFFAGTYFPPDDRSGRPGFRKVLKAVSDIYRSKKDEVSGYVERLAGAFKQGPLPAEDIEESRLDSGVKVFLSSADLQNGGFGPAPKFPLPGVMDFLIRRYFLTREAAIGRVVRKTLDSMAKGGFHDHIGGGFHRYSTDETWTIPHFEKMADDNAWLLRNYTDAYAVFKDEAYRHIAGGIISFVNNVLSDEKGGFYASQDADVTPDDEGGYFTWTEEDFKKTLDDDEFKVLSRHLLGERGGMSHDPRKKVLFHYAGPDEIAGDIGSDVNAVNDVIRRGKEKLLAVREKRPAPFVDRTMYTSLNAMLVTAYLRASRVFGTANAGNFALRSLKKLMSLRLINKKLYHSEGVRAILDDYIYLIEALINAYEVTAKRPYLIKADVLMQTCVNELWDRDSGGFFNSDTEVMGSRFKGIEDIYYPSPNSVAIILLLKLFHMTGRSGYLEKAELMLKIFSNKAMEGGLITGYFFSALDAWFNMLKITLEAAPDSRLADAVRYLFSPYVSLVYGHDRGRVIPCCGEKCFEPINNPEALRDFIINIKHLDETR